MHAVVMTFGRCFFLWLQKQLEQTEQGIVMIQSYVLATSSYEAMNVTSKN